MRESSSSPASHTFRITPARRAAVLVPAGLLVVVAVAVWSMWHAPGTPGAVRGLLTATTLLGAVVIGGTALGSQRSRATVAPDALRVRGDVYWRTVPRTALRPEAARIVDLRATRELQPTLRLFGTALPGYLAGWFRLRDGSRAFLAVTDRRRVVHVPTAGGAALLLSPDDPEGFLAALRGASSAGAPPSR